MSPPSSKIRLADRETAPSFISRLAASNWVDATTFAGDKETTFKQVIDGSRDAVEALRGFGVDIPETILDWSPVKTAGSRRNLNGTPFPTKVVQPPEMRGCPACLREDAAGSDLPPHLAMAMRGHWLVPHVSLCLEHEHPLVPLWRDPRPTSRFDSARHLAEVADNLISGRFDKTLRDPTDFDVWLNDRLQGITSGEWLDRQPLHAAANFCLMLGYALLRHEEIAPSAVDPDDRWGLQQMGFEIARGGEDAVRAALRGLQALPGGPHEGPKKVFPVLYDRLSHDYHDNPVYAAFRAILRAHMLETWPLGIGDELMGEPVMERRLHSVRTAAAATGIDRRRLRKMLSAAGLVPDGEDALPDAWQVFEAGAAEPLLRNLQQLVTASDFAAHRCLTVPVRSAGR